MTLTTERLRAFRFNLSIFEKSAEQLAADKIIADKAIADAEIEKLKNATHAAEVIKKLNDENRSQRERAEKAETAAAEAKKLIDEAAAKKLADDKKFEELYTKEKADREADAVKAKDELSKRDAAALLREVRDAAKTAGILDPDFIELPVFAEAMKLAKVDGGKVIGADDVVSKMREIKASAFKVEETADEKAKREAAEKQQRDQGGRFTRPDPNAKPTGGDIDWATLKPEEYEQKKAELRAASARL